VTNDLNRRLAELLGWRVMSEDISKSAGRQLVVHWLEGPDGSEALSAVARCGPRNSGSAEDQWCWAPDFLHQSERMLWAWERVLPMIPRFRQTIIGWSPRLGHYAQILQWPTDEERERGEVSYCAGDVTGCASELEARVQCLIMALERVKEVEE
jgi:hypothetical protein